MNGKTKSWLAKWRDCVADLIQIKIETKKHIEFDDIKMEVS